jgi:type VI secretion system secreted protein VgrG
MAGFTQTNRFMSLSVDGLASDTLLLASWKGHEAMSRLFSFTLELLMNVADPETQQQNEPVQFEDVIGKNATISVMLPDNTQRYFNGIVSQFAITAVDTKFVHYEMEVVPWTWLLTRYADCKIFHNKAVGDIIQQVFSDRDQTDFKMSLTGTYPDLEYCVQYRETDFNFISRLMEQFGIFYFFQHEEGKHTMVIADSSSAYEDCWPGHSSFGFDLAGGALDADDVVTAWSTEQLLKSGLYTLTDYNFQTPSANLVNQDPTVYAIGGNSSFELFDYPGLYINNSDGKAMAKLRMEEVEAGHLIARGSGVCRAFTSGTKFTLTNHPQSALNGSYLLTEIQHTATEASYYTGDGGAGEYSNHFTCILDSVPFRPARVTPKPFVQGPQTAVVVGTNPDSGAAGPGGEEIWVDKYGRVVVLFPWDRKSACSCWVRVSQDWAGQGWGSITIPRIGQEVIVSFLEGDPDRPIITGRVYNAAQTVPYPLPANQTRSTFMTRSSKGGSDSTYNELRFEDLSGKEQVFLRAQFDYDTQVLHDSREAIGNNRSLTVKVNQLESVGGDLHSAVTGGVFESVGKDVNTNIKGGVVETVGKDVNTAITGKLIEKITGDVNRTMSGNYVETVSGDSNSNITGNLNQKIGENLSIQVGQNLYEKSGVNYAHQAGTMIHLKGGMQVVIEAGTMLTLMVGGNSVVINSAGVSITGTMVMINSGGGAGSGCGSSPTSPTSPSSPASPVAPTAPDNADDGKTGTKLGSGSNAPAAAASADAASAASASQVAGPKLVAGPAAGVAGAAGDAAGAAGSAAGAAAGAVSQAEQAATQATQAAAQGAQQAAAAAQQAANEAQQAAQQAEQQAEAAVAQVTQQAQQTYQQAQQAVQQAEQAVSQATAQGQAAAEQALAQAQAQAMQAAQAAAQAVQDAKAKAEQVEQQAQAAAAQAEQQAQAAAAQAQAAAQQAQQQAQQAAQEGQQAAQQAQQAAQQAQQQAQQAAQQAQQAAQQAQKTAQQAGQQVTQAASQAQQQAQQAAQGAQQSASQAISQATSGL